MGERAKVRSDDLEISSIGTLYEGPMEKKYWSSSRGKEKYPYPIGFNATRFHGGHCYTMEVSSGPRGPLFRVTCEEGISCVGQTPSTPWDDILKKRHVGAKKVLLRNSCSIVDGPEMFGFTNPLVQRLCRDLVGVTSGAAEQSGSLANSKDRNCSLKANNDKNQSGVYPKEHCEQKSKGGQNVISPTGKNSPEQNFVTSRAQKLTPVKRPKGSAPVPVLEKTAKTSRSSTHKANSPKGLRQKFQPLANRFSKELEEMQPGGQEIEKCIPLTKRSRTSRLNVGSCMEDVNQDSSAQTLTRTDDACSSITPVNSLHPGTAKTKQQQGFSPVTEECDSYPGKDQASVCPNCLDSTTADKGVLINTGGKEATIQFLKAVKVPEAVRYETNVDLTSGEGVLSVELICPVAEDLTNLWSESSLGKQNPSQSYDAPRSFQQDGVFLLLEACKLAGDCVPTSPDCSPQGKGVGNVIKDQQSLNRSMSISDEIAAKVSSESPSSAVLSSVPISGSFRQSGLFQKYSCESRYHGQHAGEITMKASVEPGRGSLVPRKVVNEGMAKPMVIRDIRNDQ